MDQDEMKAEIGRQYLRGLSLGVLLGVLCTLVGFLLSPHGAVVTIPLVLAAMTLQLVLVRREKKGGIR